MFFEGFGGVVFRFIVLVLISEIFLDLCFLSIFKSILLSVYVMFGFGLMALGGWNIIFVVYDYVLVIFFFYNRLGGKDEFLGS